MSSSFDPFAPSQGAGNAMQAARRILSPHHRAPRTHLLSSGPYSVMVTAAGSGYSRWRDLALTRWREDPTCDPWGSYIYLRDAGSAEVWSAAYQPSGTEPDRYIVDFFEDRVEIARQDGPVVTKTEILLSPDGDAEVRRVSLTNVGDRSRDIDVTSYTEVVLATAAADRAHPAFSKMFVQTEFEESTGALLAFRRGTSPGDTPLWLAHVSAVGGAASGALQFESDRARFIGRGRELRTAASVIDGRSLSGTVGTVLDPVFSLRRRLQVGPGETVTVAFWTIAAPSRSQAVELAKKYCEPSAFERARSESLARTEGRLRDLGVNREEAQSFQRIANGVLYADRALKAPSELLVRNRRGQSALWGSGISGDLPIVLGCIDDDRGLGFVESLLRAHRYWLAKGLCVDLVLLSGAPASDATALDGPIESAVATARAALARNEWPGRGHVLLLRARSLGTVERDLLSCAARVILAASRGALSDQVKGEEESAGALRPRLRTGPNRGLARVAAAAPALDFFNGLGGFSHDGREYVISLEDERWTPTPWCNVIANPDFGFMVSADGTGNAWSINSRENQLTPWSNDPVSNAPAEVIYLRDMDTGDLWSATPLPIRETTPYRIRHGFGYTRCEHESHAIGLELTQFVALDAPVKIAVLRITNSSERIRHLSVTHYVEWVLGRERGRSAEFLITGIDHESGAMLARNPWNSGFEARVAFMDLCGRQQSFTADRSEFLGRHGSLAEPAALLRGGELSNRIGAGFDPCGAMQTQQIIPPGQCMQLVFLLGEGVSEDDALCLINRYRAANPDEILAQVHDWWNCTLGTVQVGTPERALDIMVNGWFLYQALACRLWARTGFYQASGAYGFRDQLQDVMALCIARPELTRAHILRAAGRQFKAGDVQHWWLPSSGLGLKTRISDNRIWLPYVTAHYIHVTGDRRVLDEEVAFLEGGPLAADQHELFAAPAAGAPGSLYEHCALALDSSLGVGLHGLPLMGAGDWNDGMNRVGAGGRGESVWLGWFLYSTLLAFAPAAEARGDTARGSRWRGHARALLQAIEQQAWDGGWYRRGYFDDGTPLGSATSDECRIDSIAQSWALLSGAAEHSRAVRAMSAVEAQLVNRDGDGLVRLFAPAFDRTTTDPGYIKAYPPGIRENGGQYTHAAAWAAWAFAMLGDGDSAGRLLSLLNPIHHAVTLSQALRYQVEPYVVCADIYTAPSRVGRGGWTWYTGSAGWLYRTALEAILGFTLEAGSLRIDPCIPRNWPRFEITYRHRTSVYHITVLNPSAVNRGVRELAVDGVPAPASTRLIALVDDGRTHEVRVTLGE